MGKTKTCDETERRTAKPEQAAETGQSSPPAGASQQAGPGHGLRPGPADNREQER